MGLNLNSLKNLSSAPANSSAETSNNLVSPTQDITAISPINAQEEKAISVSPKLSLLKLKKASGIDTSVTPIETEIPVGQLEKGQLQDMKSLFSPEVNNVVSPISKIEETSINPEPATSTIEIIPVEAVAQETQSIIVEEIAEPREEIKEVVEATTEPKEFFPKFHITDTLNLDEDLQDLNMIKEHEEPGVIENKPVVAEIIEEEITVIPEIREETISTSSDMETIETKTPTISNKENTIIHEELPQEAVTTEVPSEASSENTTPAITPEYVAEVKTELSENRRAGFRFFIQHKTKILAGVSFVAISGLAMTFFSDSLFSTRVQQSGKTNIQEVTKEPVQEIKVPPQEEVLPPPTQDNVPPNEEITTEQQPTIPSYEMGRDYSITKNTKKNIRIKTDTGAIGTITP